MTSVDGKAGGTFDQASFKVEGSTALITGGASGIGFAFAKLLHSKGANVVIADIAIRPETEQFVQDLEGKTSQPRIVFIKADVTLWPELDRMFRIVDDEFGGADLICPGAGVFEPHWSNFWHPPGSAVSRDSPAGDPATGLGHYSTLDLNLIHPIRVTQMAIARWLSPKQGAKVSPSNPKRIVHITSVAGQLTGIISPLYHISKHGVSALIRSMGELEPRLGIRVNGVAPALIMTPLWTEKSDKAQLMDEQSDSWVSAEEVAEGMLALATEQEWKGGQVVEITRNKRRLVKPLNDGGPDRKDLAGFDFGNGAEEVFEWLGQEGWGMPK